MPHFGFSLFHDWFDAASFDDLTFGSRYITTRRAPLGDFQDAIALLARFTYRLHRHASFAFTPSQRIYIDLGLICWNFYIIAFSFYTISERSLEYHWLDVTFVSHSHVVQATHLLYFTMSHYISLSLIFLATICSIISAIWLLPIYFRLRLSPTSLRYFAERCFSLIAIYRCHFNLHRLCSFQRINTSYAVVFHYHIICCFATQVLRFAV